MNRIFSRRFWLSSSRLLLAITVCASLFLLWPTAARAERFVYFGTYTGKKSKGIYVARFNEGTGRLANAELAGEIASPSFLAAHPNGRFLYAVAEAGSGSGKPGGAVSAFAIDSQTGRLTHLNDQSSKGGGPCHLVVDKAGRNVLIANYGGGSAAVLPVRKDGGLEPISSFIQHQGSGANQARQGGPHAHGIYLDAANHFSFVPDLGLDKVMIYRFDSAKGQLTPNDPPSGSVAPGSGPRHFAFHPHGRYAYVINEMLCTVTAFSYDPKSGELQQIQTISSLPLGQAVEPGYSTAELFAHPSGKFLYGSNRGHNTIVSYAIDPKNGRLSLIGHAATGGKTPRGFGIDPGGRWLLAANQDSDTVVVLGIDTKSGQLTYTGQTLEVPAPVSVEFVRAK